jgi:hypothetical protein
MGDVTFATPKAGQTDPEPSLFDLGHQGDVDRTQIAQQLRLTPTERLRHHESWRLFVMDALRRAELHRTSSQCPEQPPS